MAEKFPLMTYVTGILARLNANSRKPTAYLYNGIRLPALPEWDRAVYPYAYIVVRNSAVVSGAKVYSFYAVPGAAHYTSNSNGVWWSIAAGKRLSTSYTDYTNTTVPDWQTDKWADIAESESDNGMMLGYEDGSYSKSIVWCNTDMVRPDGSIYLAASDPVPVYE